MTPSTENVLAVFKRATTADIRAGFRWYNRAHDLALSLSPDDVRIGAGVIAALSPNNHWDTNVKAARKVFENGTAFGTHYSANEAKADAILAGADPTTILGQGKGRKVISFYHTIVNPDGFFTPTVDRHAFDITVNSPGAYLANDGARFLNRKGMYDAFALPYLEAAIELCIGAPRVQAITWITWRREKGIR